MTRIRLESLWPDCRQDCKVVTAFSIMGPEAGRRAHVPRHCGFGRFNLAGRPACHVQAPCKLRQDQSTAVSGLSGNVPQTHRHWWQAGPCRLAPSRAGMHVNTASPLVPAYYLNADPVLDVGRDVGHVAVHCNQAERLQLGRERQGSGKYLPVPVTQW